MRGFPLHDVLFHRTVQRRPETVVLHVRLRRAAALRDDAPLRNVPRLGGEPNLRMVRLRITIPHQVHRLAAVLLLQLG